MCPCSVLLLSGVLIGVHLVVAAVVIFGVADDESSVHQEPPTAPRLVSIEVFGVFYLRVTCVNLLVLLVMIFPCRYLGNMKRDMVGLVHSKSSYHPGLDFHVSYRNEVNVD